MVVKTSRNWYIKAYTTERTRNSKPVSSDKLRKKALENKGKYLKKNCVHCIF